MPGSHSTRLPLVLAGMAAMVIVTVLVMWTVIPRIRAGRSSSKPWMEHLASLSDDEAIDELVRAGGERVATRRLVAALASDRPAVSSTARDLLIDLLDRWQLEPPPHASPDVARLAHQLAQQPVGNGESHAAAAEVATRILVWPIDPAVVDPEQVISDCEAVLRRNSFPRDKMVSGQRDFGEPVRDAQDAQVTTRWETQSGIAASHSVPAAKGRVEDQFRMPGGNLPFHVSDLPSEPSAAAAAPSVPSTESSENEGPGPAAASADRAARRANHATGAQGADWDRRESPKLLQPVPARRIDRQPAQHQQALQPDTADRSAPMPASAAAGSADWGPLGDMQVMRALHAEDESVAASARKELQLRGYQTDTIQFAHGLTSPSPTVRLQLVEQLPRLSGVDALKWLRWMGEDEHADVRLTALTILATSPHPQVDGWLRESLQRESEPELRRRIEQMLQVRDHRR